MEDAVDVVDVLLVEILRGVYGDDRLQRRRIPHRHLDRVEAAPGDAEHADLAGRERLLREPVDHHLAVVELGVRILVRNQPPLRVAGAADVDARDDVSALDEV